MHASTVAAFVAVFVHICQASVAPGSCSPGGECPFNENEDNVDSIGVPVTLLQVALEHRQESLENDARKAFKAAKYAEWLAAQAAGTIKADPAKCITDDGALDVNAYGWGGGFECKEEPCHVAAPPQEAKAFGKSWCVPKHGYETLEDDWAYCGPGCTTDATTAAPEAPSTTATTTTPPCTGTADNEAALKKKITDNPTSYKFKGKKFTTGDSSIGGVMPTETWKIEDCASMARTEVTWKRVEGVWHYHSLAKKALTLSPWQSGKAGMLKKYCKKTACEAVCKELPEKCSAAEEQFGPNAD